MIERGVIADLASPAFQAQNHWEKAVMLAVPILTTLVIPAGLYPCSRLFWACDSMSCPTWDGRWILQIQSTCAFLCWPLASVAACCTGGWAVLHNPSSLSNPFLVCKQLSFAHQVTCEKHQTEMLSWSAAPEKGSGESAVPTLRFQTASYTDWSERESYLPIAMEKDWTLKNFSVLLIVGKC